MPSSYAYPNLLSFDENLVNCPYEWDSLKKVLQDAAASTFDMKKRKSKSDWFDDNDNEIKSLLQNKSLNKSEIQKRVRTLKNDWFIQKANEAERFHNEKNRREFYNTMREMYGPTSKRSHPIRKKDGQLVTTRQKA